MKVKLEIDSLIILKVIIPDKHLSLQAKNLYTYLLKHRQHFPEGFDLNDIVEVSSANDKMDILHLLEELQRFGYLFFLRDTEQKSSLQENGAGV